MEQTLKDLCQESGTSVGDKIICPKCKNEKNRNIANFCRICGKQLKDPPVYVNGCIPK